MISANEGRPHLLTYIIAWKDRKRRYLFTGIVDELSAAKLEAFPRSQGESILHILLEVGAIASNNL